MASRTYSFKDTGGAFFHPLAGPFAFSGQIGMHQFTISMAAEKTVHDLAGDGTVMPSAIAGNNGQIAIEVQQTSKFHAFMLAWYNLVVTAMEQGDVTNFASASITLRNLVDGSLHELTGVSPSKVPDKTYAQQGQHITWVLMAADIRSVTIPIF